MSGTSDAGESTNRSASPLRACEEAESLPHSSALQTDDASKPPSEQAEAQQHADNDTQVDAEASEATTLFDVAIEKTAAGFGIYFTKREAADSAPLLVVDGFVETAEPSADTSADARAAHTLERTLRLGDVLVGVNGTACDTMDAIAVVALLRAAPLGSNVLQFRRSEASAVASADSSDESASTAKTTDAGAASITSSFFGALRKVKTKIREGIEGDEEQLQREQEERLQFETAWLAAFDRLKREYETKWETCTYSADEFCGLLFRSADAQQKEYLLREYPLLMDAWSDASVAATARLAWPAPRVSYSAPIEYRALTQDAARESDPALAPRPVMRTILSAPALHRVLDALRSEFAWRRADVLALEQRLAASEIFCCSDLTHALEARSGHFERRFQSTAYPRLTSAICRALLAHARHGASIHEDIR